MVVLIDLSDFHIYIFLHEKCTRKAVQITWKIVVRQSLKICKILLRTVRESYFRIKIFKEKCFITCKKSYEIPYIRTQVIHFLGIGSLVSYNFLVQFLIISQSENDLIKFFFLCSMFFWKPRI